MREILFRGKRVDNGEWVLGYYYKILGRCFIHKLEGDIDGKTYASNVYEVIPETVGQFTELHDKNEKEIFEGDIVKAVALSNDHHQRGAITISSVEYWCGNACLSITYTPIYPFCVDHDLEVIGNIYEHPHLLKTKGR